MDRRLYVVVCLHDLCVQYLHVWCLPKCGVTPRGSRNQIYQHSIFPSGLMCPLWCNSLSLLSLLLLPHHLSISLWSQTLHHPHLTSISSPNCFIHWPLYLFTRLPLSFLFFSLQGNTIESEHLSELTEEEYEAHIYQRQDLKGFMWLDAKYLNPFFTRRLTQEVRVVERYRNLFGHL